MNRIAGLTVLSVLSLGLFACSRDTAASKPNASPSGVADTSPKGMVLGAYLKAAAALAADDFGAAKSAAAEMAGQANKAEPFKELAAKAEAVAQAANISDARKAFQVLSAGVEPLVTGDKAYVVMHCPMVNADWVQTSLDVRNPYYGKMMLDCGAPKPTK